MLITRYFTFTQKDRASIYLVYEIKLWPYRYDEKLVKPVKKADKYKYKYSGYGIGFDNHGTFSMSNGSGSAINVITFGADMSSYAHINNKKKMDILILGKGPTDGLDDTMLTEEKEYSINFTERDKKFCLGLYYNETSSYLFIDGVEIIRF